MYADRKRSTQTRKSLYLLQTTREARIYNGQRNYLLPKHFTEDAADQNQNGKRSSTRGLSYRNYRPRIT